MLNLDLYIHSAGYIAPAAAPDEPVLQLRCAEPDYSSYNIPPMQLRRMSRIVRMGIGAAKMALRDAGMETPDALSVGTAFGCLQDTEIFLRKMVEQDEKMLTPTAFIQSTHNTVAGQIALLTGCRGHNMTYVQRGHSFEQALLNTALYLAEHPGHNVLAGGIDELTDSSVILLQRAGIFTKEKRAPKDLATQSRQGSIGGEGASFFVINKQSAGAALRLRSLCIFQAKDTGAALDRVEQWLRQAGIDIHGIDAVALGINGDHVAQPFYDRVREAVFIGKPVFAFKQWCGEYPTAAAYALAVIAHGMPANDFPEGYFDATLPVAPKRIMLINHYCNDYSCYLLERPE